MSRSLQELCLIPRLFSRLTPAALLLSCIALPSLAADTVISSTADCHALGGTGRWSNPASWTPMQIPDNRQPGVTYNVTVSGLYCLGMILDASVTINELTMSAGYWGGSREKKAAKVSASGVSLTILKDARIDELGMANGKLDIGGTAWVSGSDGWVVRDTQVKARDFVIDGNPGVSFDRTAIDIARSTLITEFAWVGLSETALETGDLYLGSALSLGQGASIRVKGNYEMNGPYSSLGILLDGRTSFVVSGNATLAGSLNCWLEDGYVPYIGEQFTILTVRGSINGDFSRLALPQLSPDRAWSLFKNGQWLVLKVVPAT